MRKLLFYFIILFSCQSLAQKRVGDYIESISYNDCSRGLTRKIQYEPYDGGFVCMNGNNRFTRALYGGYTNYRLETSDRPVFVLFKDSRNYRHVDMRFSVNGHVLALDSTSWCKSFYSGGKRIYEVKDKSWRGKLIITSTCIFNQEGAVWEIKTDSFLDVNHLKLNIIVSGIREKKLNRNGDMGADRPGCFESDGHILQQLEIDLSKNAIIFADDLKLRLIDENECRLLLSETEKHLNNICNTISFKTPDEYINTLGSALSLAADGAWDGETWLHGAIGWRTQLAGWRGGYLGDVLGWNNRAISHFDAYAQSIVKDVNPIYSHPSQDSLQNLARAEKKWGTQMYSNGYICRRPNGKKEMSHYDMNLNYIDELLWHFQYNADTSYMRKMFPILKLHLDWEKRNFDPDDDGLYDGYCCIWASDALYYNSGAVTHASAYNYRANLLTAKIAHLLNEDAQPYEAEANKILSAMNKTLWLEDKGHWAEYKDYMGLKRLHADAALWSIYTAIDCGACTNQQAWRATDYVIKEIPHIKIADYISLSNEYKALEIISSSNWMPYSWSINNVAAAEIMHTALSFFEAGRNEEAYSLMKANILDQMYLGSSPGNFGQVSYLDAARGECYRDFADNTGISARTLIQGLFGIVPQALDGKCMIRPGFPSQWNEASVHTPYLSYRFHRDGNKDIYEVRQNFTQPLQIILRYNIGEGHYKDIVGTTDSVQTIVVENNSVQLTNDISKNKEQSENTIRLLSNKKLGLCYSDSNKVYSPHSLTQISLDKWFNANIDDIFKNEYLSPRSPYTSLQIPKQGVGEWCHPLYCPEINDSVYRSLLVNNQTMVNGVKFKSPAEGNNIIFTSLWDNYPDSICIPLKGKASFAHLLMAGSTNHMQCRIDNALVIVNYKDGTNDTLHIIPPYNWCPIEQDYYIDGKAFKIERNNERFEDQEQTRPIRICLGTGQVSRDIGKIMNIKGVYGREIPGGAALLLQMPLNRKKPLRSLTLRTLSNDVVVGLMALTLEK